MTASKLTLTRAYKGIAAGTEITVTDSERTYLVEQKFANDPNIKPLRPGIIDGVTFPGVGGNYENPRQVAPYGSEPYDPADHTAAEVLAYLKTVGGEEARRVQAAEKTGQNRTTIVNYLY